MYHNLLKHFNDLKKSENFTLKALGISGEAVLSLKMKVGIKPIHYLAMLLDPFNKDEIRSLVGDSKALEV